MVTERDEIALSFIEEFQVATTSQINEVAYDNMRVCQRRMAALVNDGILVRGQSVYTKEYIYSCKPINTRQLRHKLLRVKFYLELRKVADISSFFVEKQLENLRPDGLVIAKHKVTGKDAIFALEVETSNNKVNIKKYDEFVEEHFDKFFDVPPSQFFVAVLTTKPIAKSDVVKVVRFDKQFTDIEKLFCD